MDFFIPGWFFFVMEGIFEKVLSDNCLLLMFTSYVPPVAWHILIGVTYSSWKCRTLRKSSNSFFPFCQAAGWWCAVLHSGGCSPGLWEVLQFDTSQGRFYPVICLLPVIWFACCQLLFKAERHLSLSYLDTARHKYLLDAARLVVFFNLCVRAISFFLSI